MTIWDRLMIAFGFKAAGSTLQLQQRQQSLQRIHEHKRSQVFAAADRQLAASASMSRAADVAHRLSLETAPVLEATLSSLDAFVGDRER